MSSTAPDLNRPPRNSRCIHEGLTKLASLWDWLHKARDQGIRLDWHLWQRKIKREWRRREKKLNRTAGQKQDIETYKDRLRTGEGDLMIFISWSLSKMSQIYLCLLNSNIVPTVPGLPHVFVTGFKHDDCQTIPCEPAAWWMKSRCHWCVSSSEHTNICKLCHVATIVEVIQQILSNPPEQEACEGRVKR